MKHERIEGPITRAARKYAALCEARARFRDKWEKLTAELQAEERRIEREFA